MKKNLTQAFAFLFAVLYFNSASAQWVASSGMTGLNGQRFVKSGGKVFVGTGADGMWKSSDDGVNWVQVNNGLPLNASVTELSVLGNNTIIAATYDNGVWKSNNAGANWMDITGTLPIASAGHATAIAASSTMIAVGIEGQGIFYTTDSGTTWTIANTGWTTNMFYRTLLIVNADIYATTQDGVFKCNTSNYTWSPITTGLPANNTSCRCIHNQNDTLYLGTSTDGIYRSLDHGQNWVSMNTLSTFGFRVSTIITDNNTIYFASNGAADNVYSTPKNGPVNWTVIGTGCASSPNDIVISNSKLLAATGADGPYYFTMTGTVTAMDEKSVSDVVTIYPNPFASQTTINFSEAQVNTTVKIINILGNVVKAITFSGNKLVIEKGEMPAGTYFVQITDVNKNVLNKKIVVQ